MGEEGRSAAAKQHSFSGCVLLYGRSRLQHWPVHSSRSCAPLTTAHNHSSPKKP